MSDEPKKSKPGVAKWFLKTLFTSPSTWIGLAAGTASGMAFVNNGPASGAVGFGMVVALAAGVMSWGLITTVRVMYANAQQAKGKATGSNAESLAVVDDLREAGHTEDAEVLEKMFADRDAIRKLCGDRDLLEDVDAAHTLELVEAIVLSSVGEAEELQDLLRRAEDPLLDGPKGAEELIAASRQRTRAAYQAVADSRRRLRRGEKLHEVDFLAEPEAALPDSDLAELTGRLEEETAISRRVEERLHGERPDRADWMEDADEGEEADDAMDSVAERLSEGEQG